MCSVDKFILCAVFALSGCATICEHKIIYEGAEYYGCTTTIEGAF